MASLELQRLWKLAEIDRKILEIRKRAAALGSDPRLQSEFDAVQAQSNAAEAKLKALQQEVTDLEIGQKAADDKVKKVNAEIYGGKVVNPKEITNLEKELQAIKKKKDADGDQLLNLYDEVAPVKAEFDRVHAELEKKRAEVRAMKEKALTQRKQLEDAFKDLASRRPIAAKAISPNLVARYEAIRQKQNGIGMVEVDRKTGNCAGCGTHLPERSIQIAKEDKVITCEACRRILYYTEGAV